MLYFEKDYQRLDDYFDKEQSAGTFNKIRNNSKIEIYIKLKYENYRNFSMVPESLIHEIHNKFKNVDVITKSMVIIL